MARVTAKDISSLDLPSKEKRRLKELAALGLTRAELEGILRVNSFTPVIIKYDIRTDASLTEEQLEDLIEDFRKDVQAGMMAREVGFLFLKGLGLAAKAAAVSVL